MRLKQKKEKIVTNQKKIFLSSHLERNIKIILILLVLFTFTSNLYAQLDESLLKNFKWRSVGPVGAGGRVTDIAVVGKFPYHIYVATASGGLWKTSNNGVTWEPVFDKQSTSSIGAVAVHPTNPDIIWVGTGEVNARNTVSWGDGVFKSTDGGITWQNMGLKDSHHIGRLIIDPDNPNTVYVAALGHVWGPNDERGLYKTTDGGVTWTKCLGMDRDTGFIDVAMAPDDSKTLYAASYQVRRDGFATGNPAIMTGPGSGLYKTTDSGRTWKKLKKGLPKRNLGRIGIAVSQNNPEVVYAIIQTETTLQSMSTMPGDLPPEPKTMEDGGVFRSQDRGETWQWVNPINPRPFYFGKIRVDPKDENRVYVLGNNLSISEDGGKNFQGMPGTATNIHSDHHALWINPDNPQHLVLGNDGGIYFSYDGGKTWDYLNQMALGQFYAIDVDMRRPYYIYGGVQESWAWGGPSATRNIRGITEFDWIRVFTGDGIQVRIDPNDHTIIYAEAQNCRLVRHDLKTGRNTIIKPQPKEGEEEYRFNWETPIIISPHDSKTLYVGGSYVFKSTDRGNSWTIISPDLTTATETQSQKELKKKKSAEKESKPRKIGSITTLAESPIKPGLIYVGTDDGNVHITPNGGVSWKDITSNFPGMPGKRWISRVIASCFDEATAYVTFDGHRNDDYAPYVFKSTNFGQSWTNISNNLPSDSPVRVIREDYKNPDLLFLGTEFAAWVSIDGGAKWVKLMSGMPTVPVADLLIHPRDRDLIAGTHGRSVYVMDISPLQELNRNVLEKDIHLFSPKPSVAFQYRAYSDHYGLGNKRFIAHNPEVGPMISYYLKETISIEKEKSSAEEKEATKEGKKSDVTQAAVKITILNKSGEMIRELKGPAERGLHRVNWDLRHTPPVQDEDSAEWWVVKMRGHLAEPGEYIVKLTVGSRQCTAPLVVESDPILEISDIDRKSRQDTIKKIIPLQASSYSANKQARSLDRKIKDLQKTLTELPDISKDLRKRLDAVGGEATELAQQLNRLNSSITSMYKQIVGSYSNPIGITESPFAPTLTQLRILDELTVKLKELVPSLNQLITETIPELNHILNKEKIPRIKTGEPIKIKS